MRTALDSATGRLGLDVGFDGDYHVDVDVAAFDCAGRAGGHVIRGAFERFVVDLSELERTSRGEAAFESAVPGLFALRIAALDRLGHLGVSGVVARDVGASRVGSSMRLEFGFEIEPSALASFAGSMASIVESVR